MEFAERIQAIGEIIKKDYLPLIASDEELEEYLKEEDNYIEIAEAPFEYTVNAIEGAQTSFSLNANGFWESQNKGIHNSYSLCRIQLKVFKTTNIVFNVINSGESSYDFGVFSKLDTALGLSYSIDNSALIHKSFSGQSSTSIVQLIYENIEPREEEYFIDIKFRKDGSNNTDNDSLQFQIVTPDYLLLPVHRLTDSGEQFIVKTANSKQLSLENFNNSNTLYLEENGEVITNNLSGQNYKIFNYGSLEKWYQANLDSLLTIDLREPSNLYLHTKDKMIQEDIRINTFLEEEQTITPDRDSHEIIPQEGYMGLKKVVVNPIGEEYKILEGEIEITEPGQYDIDITEKLVEKVKVNIDAGNKYNLAFGDTAPEDTNKLWIKTAEPTEMQIKLNAEVTGNDGLLSGIAAIPTAAYGIGTAAVGTKVYLFGGRIGTNDTSSNSYSSAIRVFDTETGTVETLSTTLPNKAEGIAAAAVGTKVYLFGGYYYSSGKVYSSAIRVFDTETGTIETLSATLPKGAYNMGAAAVGTKIYLFGGYISSTSASGSYISAIRVFNTETGTIETLSTTLPQPSEGTGAAAVGTKIYLFGGYRYYSGAEYLSAIRVFNTETGTIETLSTTLPTAAYKMGVAAVGTKIYLFGGVYSSYISRIDVFDTETGTIETLSTTLPTATYSMGTATVGTKVYLFGGCYSSTYYSSIHQFTARIDLPENHLMIEASAFENRFNLSPNMEMGVKNVFLGNADGKGERVAAALYKNDAWVEI